MKQHSTRTRVEYTIPKEYRELDEAKVQFVMADCEGNVLAKGNADYVNRVTGDVCYCFKNGDTEVPGTHNGEFHVTYKNGTFMPFPQDDFIKINIAPSIEIDN